MKKRAIIVTGVAAGGLVLVTALGAGAAGEDQGLPDEEMLDLIEEVETACLDADCAQGDPLSDEQVDALGFDSLLITDAWGICVIEGGGGPEQTCVCTEPEPPAPPIAPLPDQTAIYVGKNGAFVVVYDTVACKGLYYEGSGWTWTVAGGCRKAAGDIEHLEMLGNQSTAIDEDNVFFVWGSSSAGNCYFADWWSGDYYWDSVTADGRNGRDDVRGSPQDDDLEGEIVRGYAGDDAIQLTSTGITNPIAYGGDDNDTITGSAAGDIIQGDNGNDTIYGEGGTDTLYGENGNDFLRAGDGDGDRLYGGSGYDNLDGFAGDNGEYCDCGASSDPAAGPNCDTVLNCND